MTNPTESAGERSATHDDMCERIEVDIGVGTQVSPCYCDYRALEHDLSAPDEQAVACSTDPNARHGFDRNASHSEGRYVCECESTPAAESALEGAKARFCINPDAPVELIFTADKILVNTHTPEPGKNPMGHVALNVNAEQAEKILATLREHQALQSRLDAAERDAARMDWLVKMKATVYAAFEVGETMVQHWVTVDERGKERHGCVAETLRESIDKAIAEQPNLIDAFNGRAPFPDIAALSASAESENKGGVK